MTRTVQYMTYNDGMRHQRAVKISLDTVQPQDVCAEHLEHLADGHDRYRLHLGDREWALLLTQDGETQKASMLEENDLAFLLQSANGENAWTYAERIIGLPPGTLELAFEGETVNIKEREEYQLLLRELMDIVLELTHLPEPQFKRCLTDLQQLKQEHELDAKREDLIARALHNLATQWRMPEAEDGDAS